MRVEESSKRKVVKLFEEWHWGLTDIIFYGKNVEIRSAKGPQLILSDIDVVSFFDGASMVFFYQGFIRLPAVVKEGCIIEEYGKRRLDIRLMSFDEWREKYGGKTANRNKNSRNRD